MSVPGTHRHGNASIDSTASTLSVPARKWVRRDVSQTVRAIVPVAPVPTYPIGAGWGGGGHTTSKSLKNPHAIPSTMMLERSSSRDSIRSQSSDIKSPSRRSSTSSSITCVGSDNGSIRSVSSRDSRASSITLVEPSPTIPQSPRSSFKPDSIKHASMMSTSPPPSPGPYGFGPASIKRTSSHSMSPRTAEFPMVLNNPPRSPIPHSPHSPSPFGRLPQSPISPYDSPRSMSAYTATHQHRKSR
ncbi:hypothetical protein MIND_00436500 [Mycena indigotica]|uniref:Uncharacterized protein n=1 Tax=Mycena indigotica TaxID=2126181 RepID=A0A8H6W9C1_9AGAR|nr:uncharacterized protein MIND_00436500 [Mycena indigotica]KAF7306453.1 hypothetical protein MIND_00436500 [Mycena indigotica]